MQRDLRIGIVGGGPGGLTLARILATHGISSTVFELDEHEGARPQGGSLDLHTESGLLALKQAGLWAEFECIARYEDQGMRLYDKAATLLFDEDDGTSPDLGQHDRPEVDRTALRSILLASLEPGVVRWGQRIQRVEPRDDGTVWVHTDRTIAGPFDLVVGCDGTWSKVRPLVSQARPIYTGVTFIELSHEDVDTSHPELARLNGRGKMFALCSGKAIISQRNGGGHFRTYLGFREPESWAADRFDFDHPERARQQLVEQFDGWAENLRDIMRTATDRIVPRALYALPVGHRWETRRGVTLLGDAAHVMSPFSGEGVNIAMLDATLLAEKLATVDDTTRAIADYETDMFVRAAEAARGAAQGIATAFSDDAPGCVLEWFRNPAG